MIPFPTNLKKDVGKQENIFGGKINDLVESSSVANVFKVHFSISRHAVECKKKLEEICSVKLS